MTDCISLPNVAELVNFLRGEAKELSMLANGKTECNALWKAADAIESLLAENAKLKAERDAAVADLKNLAYCSQCLHEDKFPISNPCCVCQGDKWEWRGVKMTEG